MTEITREKLYQNLREHLDKFDADRNDVWQRLMKLLDVTTARGHRDCVVSQGDGFTEDEMVYIRKRVVDEGWAWRWGPLLPLTGGLRYAHSIIISIRGVS